MNYPNKIKIILKTVCIIGISVNISAYISPEPDQIDILNQLVQVNIDRIAGYETASEEVEEKYLKKIFIQFANHSRTCKTALESEVIQLLGKPVEGTKTTLKMYQVWMNALSMFSNHDIETILHTCNYGETITENVYDKIIAQNQQNLTPQQMTMILAQTKLLKADHDRVTSLQNLMSVNY